MKIKNHARWLVSIGILVLVGVCILGSQLAYMLHRQNRLQSRPVVLILSPVNHEQIETGTGVIIDATARSIRGITRMELWVDDQLFASQAAGAEGAQSPFVLNEIWLATASGPHVIQVRAISSNGIEGQSTITVELSDSMENAPYTLQEGETLADVAEQFDLTPEELNELNPGINPEDVAPGDTLTLPDTDTGEEDGSAPPAAPEVPAADEAVAPEADAPEPGSFFELATLFGFADFFDTASSTPVELRLEVLSLETSQTYDNLHCYIGVGESLPQWYPDVDLNQSTDESFTMTDDGWNVADYYAGAQAPLFAWPGNQTLPFSINCVGVLGGVEAVPAGSLDLMVETEAWDGITRSATGSGEGTSFQIEYRILYADSVPHGIPIFLDPSMTSPSNLWLDERRYALHWDYEPRPDELEVDGFRIYLNGNLQWAVRGNTMRQSDIPPEWFHPPCGDEYLLSVSAYRNGYPDGPESMSAMPPVSIVTPPDQCQKQIEMTFLSLRTFELGGDVDGDESDGDVGSVYGDFIANEQVFSIDSRSSERHGLGQPYGFYDFSQYDFSSFSSDIGWHATGSPTMLVEIEPDGTFQYGFSIMDHDWGRCRHSDDSGCDDLLCEGMSYILYDHYGNLDTVQEQTLRSTNDRCEVTVRFGPAPGSIVGSAGDAPALPYLSVENYQIDDATNTIHYDIVNTGTGTWPTQPLEIWMVDREGNQLERQMLNEFRLEPGQSGTMEYISRFSPLEVCIALDPNNAVLERYESGDEATTFRRYCPPLPDLVIRSVAYDSQNGDLVVIAQNVGYELRNRFINFAIPGTIAGTTVVSYTTHVTYLDVYGSLAIRIPVTPEQRNDLVNGYDLIVDYDDRISEMDEENNEFHVSGRTQYWITWHHGCSTGYVVGLTNDVHLHLDASIQGVVGEQELFSWGAPELSGYSTFGRKCWGYDHPENDPTYFSDRFFLVGDEQLKVRVSNSVNAGAEHYGVGAIEFIIDPSDPYGDQAFVDPNSPTCDAERGDPGYYGLSYSYPGSGRRPDPGLWSTLFKICRVTGD